LHRAGAYMVLGKICWNRMGMGINSWELGGDGDSVLYHLICFSHVHKESKPNLFLAVNLKVIHKFLAHSYSDKC